VKKGLRPLLTRIALSCSVTRLGCFFLAKKIPILHAISQSANRESNLQLTRLSRHVTFDNRRKYSVNPRGVPGGSHVGRSIVDKSTLTILEMSAASHNSRDDNLFDCKFALNNCNKFHVSRMFRT